MPLALKRPARFPARTPRAAVCLTTHVFLTDDRIASVKLLNLSERGFMGRCEVPLAEGAWLGVELPGYGIARAIVRWRHADEIGCQFRRPIATERIAASLPF